MLFHFLCTCRYLAHGDSYYTIAGRHRLSVATVSQVVPNVCKEIWKAMSPIYLAEPTKEQWMDIERKFSVRWQFSNCLGAIDGKHMQIRAPPLSSTIFYNYKGTYSIVLLAIVDAEYRFTYVDVGQYGSNSDSAVFRHSNMGIRFNTDDLNIPPPKKLDFVPDGHRLATPIPYCIVGDEAFPLQANLMRPFPRGQRVNRMPYEQQVFNYRLSRARRIVENAFGILAQRWRLYDRRMALLDHNCVTVVKASCVLHNFLTKPSVDIHQLARRLNPNGDPYLTRRGALQPLSSLHGFHSSNDALRVRNIYKDYFMSQYGNVQFQDHGVRNM